MITKAHKIEIYPTPEQEVYFYRACGCARWAFNWGLSMYNRAKQKRAKTNPTKLKKAFNKIKPAFFLEVTSWVYQGAFMDLQSAISRYYNRKDKPPKGWKGRTDNLPFGWPRFKSRNRTIPAFYIANIALKLNNKWFQFDKKRVGWIKMGESLRFEGKVMGARIRREGNRWWLSVQVQTGNEIPLPPDNPDKIIGVDLGVRYLATVSRPVVIDNQKLIEIPNPKPLIVAQKKLRRLQRRLDRQRRSNNPDNFNDDGTVKNGPKSWISSNRQQQTEQQISALHFRIKSIRANASHKLTKALTTQADAIVIEDLNVKGMVKNRKLAKHISDAAFYEKRRQIEYKSQWYGTHVHIVDRWYPSSKTCSGCGWINAELKSEKQWICRECGQVNERDKNAAKNLEMQF